MRRQPIALPHVNARAVIETDGVRSEKTVRLFEKLPGWWFRAHVEQRTLWLREYFRRELRLTPDQGLVSVEVTA